MQESFIWGNGECRVKSEMANCVNFARRMRLIALYFQLEDHIPTIGSYFISIISLGVKPPPMTVSQGNSNLELRLSLLVIGDSEVIREYSDKYIVPEKLVADYVEHLTQIKMRKEKKKEENERERMERLNQK